MKSSWILFYLLFFLLMFTACSANVEGIPPFIEQPVEGSKPTATPEPPSVTQTPAPELQPTPTQKPNSANGYPEAAFKAQAALAELLGVPLDTVVISGVETVEWPDGCLGLGRPDEMCLQVIIPGYLVKLQVDQAEYYYHTDAKGDALRLGSGLNAIPQGESSQPVLIWEGVNCEILHLFLGSASYGRCGNSLEVSEMPEMDLENYILRWLAEYQPFTAENLTGVLTLRGFGELVASPAEQRALSERAKLTFEILEAGRAGAAWGLMMTYLEDGGIAGLCNNLAVHQDGRVIVGDCKGFESQFDLTSGQLEQFYAWVDRFQPVNYQAQDPATADALTRQMTLASLGKERVGETDMQKMLEWAGELISQAKYSAKTDPADLAGAQDTLLQFFSAMESGDYAQAAGLYGGSLEDLKAWNPVLGEDLTGLLERGCTQNGLQCLPVRSVTARAPDPRGGFQFWVEFSNPDGTLFHQGPCCGEENAETLARFLVSVVKNGANWQMMDLPPYTP